MNDANALLQRVIAEAKALSIPISEEIDPVVRINTRAVTRFGRCVRKENGWEIELSVGMLTAPESSCLQVLAHEVLHTCRNCMNHKVVWRRWAKTMNAAYGYHISRTDDFETLGVEDPRIFRYCLTCDTCGKQIFRTRRSAIVKTPWLFHCTCGGNLTLTQTEEPSDEE